jgi:hypothetical protein
MHIIKARIFEPGLWAMRGEKHDGKLLANGCSCNVGMTKGDVL